MAKLSCLFGCSWELLPGSVHMNRDELFTWKCTKCGAKRVCTSNTDPEAKAV